MRQHTEIIIQRAVNLAKASGCSKHAQNTAKSIAHKWFNQGSTAANAISKGVKAARQHLHMSEKWRKFE